MIRSTVAWVTIGLLSLAASSSFAQAPDDYAFAGRSLSKLRVAVYVEAIQLKNNDLRLDVLESKLDVLYVPAKQPENENPRLYQTYAGRTRLIAVPITKQEYLDLSSFAEDKIYATAAPAYVDALTTGDETRIAQGRKALEKEIAVLDASRQDSVMRFVGALELENAPSVTSPYTAAYKKFVAGEVENSLKNEATMKKSKVGIPLVVGSGPVTLDKLKHIDPKDVEEIVIEGKKFQKAWVGSNVVVVPHDPTKSPPVKPKTGLEKLNVHPDLHKMIQGDSPGSKKLILQIRGEIR